MKGLSEFQAAKAAGDQRTEAKLDDSDLTVLWHHNNKSSTGSVSNLHNVVGIHQVVSCAVI